MRPKTIPSEESIRPRIGVAGALVLMTALGCSENSPAAPLTLESAAGRYTLESVNGKPLPAHTALTVCFLGGCATSQTLVIAGSFELGNPTAGAWSSQMTQRSLDAPAADYSQTRTGQTIIRYGRLEFKEEGGAGPGSMGGTWAGSIKADVLVIKFLDGSYSFRKVY